VARDIDGLWNIIQSNGFVVPIHVDPIAPDGAFTLEAQQGNGGVSGTGAGNVTDDFVNFVINWTNDTKGAYNGSFDEQGFIHGSTFDIRHPGHFAGWHSSKAF
jgi:hypothetical protein